MANRYEHHHHNNIHNQKSIFLPMFCRLSITDVKLSHRRPNQTPPAGEPSSPKVSCIGQVKRNNRVGGYPSAAAANHHHKHAIAKRRTTHFSGAKTLLPTTAAISSGGGGSRTRARRSREATIDFDRDCAEVVDIAEMDPPLPVVKRAPPTPGAEVNIWRRRFNGAAGGLKSLEIEKIRLPERKFQPPAPTLTV